MNSGFSTRVAGVLLVNIGREVGVFASGELRTLVARPELCSPSVCSLWRAFALVAWNKSSAYRQTYLDGCS